MLMPEFLPLHSEVHFLIFFPTFSISKIHYLTQVLLIFVDSRYTQSFLVSHMFIARHATDLCIF